MWSALEVYLSWCKLYFLKRNKYGGRKNESLTTLAGIRNKSAFDGVVVDDEIEVVNLLVTDWHQHVFCWWWRAVSPLPAVGVLDVCWVCWRSRDWLYLAAGEALLTTSSISCNWGCRYFVKWQNSNVHNGLWNDHTKLWKYWHPRI